MGRCLLVEPGRNLGSRVGLYVNEGVELGNDTRGVYAAFSGSALDRALHLGWMCVLMVDTGRGFLEAFLDERGC